MKRLKEKMKNNRGSTIIIVLVTMTFLTVLATVLMYLSLVNLQMKRIDKAGKVNFYSAEAVMNEIRAGVQEAVSGAIKEAYTNVLVNYKPNLNEEEQRQQQQDFRNIFFNELLTPAAGPSPLFPTGTTYDPAVLKSFAGTDIPAGAVIGGSGIIVPVTEDSGIVAVVLKAITVNYKANGYETTISSDITIHAPELPYTSSTSRQTAIPDFAIVAKGALQQLEASGTVGVFGNVYAGSVTVSGGGNAFNIQNAPYFVTGPVTMSGGVMNFSFNSSLWAKDIKLNTGGKLSIAGDAYIANDLNLYGNGTEAVLSGRYYGYGDSTSDPNESSSIIINGKNTLLDMSELRALLLAGHSFVNFGTMNGYVMMGESLSVKSNQLAYLVPEDCLGQIGGKPINNPYEYEGAAPSQAALENAVFLDRKVIGEKTLADYGILSTSGNIQYIRKSVGTTNLIYFCLKFNDITMPDGSVKTKTEWASEYFRDYYSANTPVIQKYVEVYSNGIVMAGNLTKNLNAEAFTFDGSELGPIIDANGAPLASINEIKNSYANLRHTLTRTESAEDVESAYEYFVNESELSTLTGTEIYPSSGNAKVIVTNGNYTLNAGPGNTVHIVIASGDVTVSGEYSGLILAGGSVTLKSGAVVTADRTAVADALEELLTEDPVTGNKYYLYFNPHVMSPMNVSTNTSGETQVWDMNSLVTYENWKKNET